MRGGDSPGAGGEPATQDTPPPTAGGDGPQTDAAVPDAGAGSPGEADGGPIAPPAREGFSFRGDPGFDAAALDDTVRDGNGLTLRDYHRKLLGTIDAAYYDDQFDRPSIRPANRRGNLHVTDMLTAGLRILGDLRFLDEAIRLLDLKKRHLEPDDDGYRHWPDAEHDQDLDVPLMAGLVARVAHAAHVNRDLASPGGWDYGAEADFWRHWLFDDYQPRWSRREGRVGELPFIRKGQGHTYVNDMATLFYMGRLGGGTVLGTTFSADDYIEAARGKLTVKLADDATCDDGHGGRTTRVWRHAVDGSSENAGALQYTTYVRYEISAYVDLLLEGFDPRLGDAYMSEVAHSFADFVIDGDPEGTGDLLASSIGGDAGDGRCGIHWTDYRSRIQNAPTRWQDSSWGLLEGWDARGHILETGFDFYGRHPSLRDEVSPYLAARILTSRYHGPTAFAP